MATYNQLLNLKKCKNKNRHRWVDDGKSLGIQLYTYQCAKCGARKYKLTSYLASYYLKDSQEALYQSPECVSTY